MSLLWIDGFDSYGESEWSQVSPTDILAQKYDNAAASSYFRVGTGLWSGYSLAVYGGNAPGTPAINTNSTIIIGFWFRTTATSGNFNIVTLRDGGTSNAALNIDVTNGQLRVYTGGVVRATVSYSNPSAWQFIEFKVNVSDSGSWEARIGGSTVASGSHDTKSGSNNYCDNVRLNGPGNSAFANVFDHFYIANGDASSPNDFLGPTKVVTIRPNADTAEADWTTQAGSDHYAMVDESTQDADTTYVEADTTDDFDLYDYQSASALGDTIHGVQINTECKETDATAFSLKTVAKSGSTVSDGAAQAIASASYKTLRRILVDDPATSVAWTSSGINAAQFGVKVG
jgi:hypothetical protein